MTISPINFSRRHVLEAILGGGAMAALLTACGGTAASSISAATTAASLTAAVTAKTAASRTTAQAVTSAAVTSAAVTAAAPTSAAPNVSSAPATVTEMADRSEWPNKQVMQQFTNTTHIKVNFVTVDLVHMIAMTAAGHPPDMYRVQAPTVPYYATTLHMAKDLTANFRLSKPLNPDNLLPVNKNYWYNGHTSFTGNIYGMVKDWSPDLSLFLNTNVFHAAGVPIPSDSTILTYTDIATMAKKLTKKQGDRTLVTGYTGSAGSWFDRQVEAMLNTEGQTMWPNFDQLDWGTKQAHDVLSYWFDLMKSGAMYSPINPEPTWGGPEIIANQVGIVQYGYWFSGEVNPAKVKGQHVRDHVVMLSAPKWGPKHTDPTITATGDMIHAHTKVPDAIWTVFEWFHSGEPALERAKSGWGVPGLQSLLNDMPTTNPFQKEVRKILDGEMKISSVAVKYNPYIPQSENTAQNAILTAWQKNLVPALKGQMTFDQLVSNVMKSVNSAITNAKQGMQ